MQWSYLLVPGNVVVRGLRFYDYLKPGQGSGNTEYNILYKYLCYVCIKAIDYRCLVSVSHRKINYVSISIWSRASCRWFFLYPESFARRAVQNIPIILYPLPSYLVQTRTTPSNSQSLARASNDDDRSCYAKMRIQCLFRSLRKTYIGRGVVDERDGDDKLFFIWFYSSTMSDVMSRNM